MATYTVTNSNDSGEGSLRAAIDKANMTAGVADEINFMGVTQPIMLTSGELIIEDSLTIQGMGIIISGNNQSRIFDIDDLNDNTTLTVVIDGLTIQDGSEFEGGGIFNAEKTTLIDSTIRQNVSINDNGDQGVGGGIINDALGTLTIQNSTISGNSALSGGGIYNSGQLTILNSTLSGNRGTEKGGGIYNYGSATIINNTIADNSASSGGGIYNNSSRTLNLKNSIVTRNGDDLVNGGPITPDNIVGNVDNLNLSPSLADNGGPTLTYALLSGSRAINAGSNTDVPAGITTDQRGAGFARIVNDIVDIGAFEFSGTNPPRPPEIDAAQYGASYPDLIQAYGASDNYLQALTEHYFTHGMAEGRSLDLFDENRYVASNTDLINAPEIVNPTTRLVIADGAAEHYIKYGYNEPRSLNRFHSDQYIASYGDLIDSFGYNLAQGTIHYIQSGFNEGRSADNFDEYRYLAGYDDLLNFYHTDAVGATEQYIRFGYKPPEQRNPLAFKSDIYIASYGDLIEAVRGTPDYADKLAFAGLHYVTHGRDEGREKERFNPASYLSNNPDVAADPFYGTAPTRHYIEHGYFEGRMI